MKQYVLAGCPTLQGCAEKQLSTTRKAHQSGIQAVATLKS